jgi:Arc/MetJ-type ribon-helix-helix transcriptional regulator
VAKLSDEWARRVYAMNDTERITVRIPAERVKALQTLVDDGTFPTISDAIRTAIDSFIEKHFTPEYIQRVTVELPKGNVVELEALVKDGDSVSIDDAIRNAVREYVRKRLTKAMNEMQ